MERVFFSTQNPHCACFGIVEAADAVLSLTSFPHINKSSYAEVDNNWKVFQYGERTAT